MFVSRYHSHFFHSSLRSCFCRFTSSRRSSVPADSIWIEYMYICVRLREMLASDLAYTISFAPCIRCILLFGFSFANNNCQYVVFLRDLRLSLARSALVCFSRATSDFVYFFHFHYAYRPNEISQCDIPFKKKPKALLSFCLQIHRVSVSVPLFIVRIQ